MRENLFSSKTESKTTNAQKFLRVRLPSGKSALLSPSPKPTLRTENAKNPTRSLDPVIYSCLQSSDYWEIPQIWMQFLSKSKLILILP